jgi:hypothetical protein
VTGCRPVAQPPDTHFRRLLRPAWAAVGQLFSPGHRTGNAFSPAIPL